tara:strand:+ start:84 stop:407 length:324 start_codon:yes stop_codon:yes gene_type:complete
MKMIRLTIEQAIDTLINIFSLDPKLVSTMAHIDLNSALIKMSNNKMCLKGTREATNISFAPKKTQATYKEAESLIGNLDRFVGKDGLEYECGVYCKKVVIKKVANKE